MEEELRQIFCFGFKKEKNHLCFLLSSSLHTEFIFKQPVRASPGNLQSLNHTTFTFLTFACFSCANTLVYRPRSVCMFQKGIFCRFRDAVRKNSTQFEIVSVSALIPLLLFFFYYLCFFNVKMCFFLILMQLRVVFSFFS